MITIAAPVPATVRVWSARHPEVPLLLAVGGVWGYLAIDHWAGHGTVESWSFGAGSWTLMAVAMMVPGVVPMYRWVAFNSLWRRRHRAALVFVTAYVAAWTALGVVLFAVAGVGEVASGRSFTPGRWWVATTLGLAAIWHVVPARKRALRRCHLRRPLIARGWRSDAAAARYGLFVAGACVVSCGGVMVAMFVGAHDFHLMVPLTAIVLIERFQFRPDERIGAVAVALVGVTSLVA